MFLLLVYVVLLMVSAIAQENIENEKWYTVAIFSIIYAMLFMGMGIEYEDNYKQGQIDAVIGNIKYEKVNDEEWKLIKENENE